MRIKLHSKEEQSSIRRSSMNDQVFPNCFSTIRKYVGHLPNSLSAIDIWVAAGDFADILLKLVFPEEEVAYEAEDLAIDCANETEAFLIMVICANRLAPLRDVRGDIDQLIGLLSKYYENHALYAEVCLSISEKESHQPQRVSHDYKVRTCRQIIPQEEKEKVVQELAKAVDMTVENGGNVNLYLIRENEVVNVDKLHSRPSCPEKRKAEHKRVGKKPSPVVVDSTYTYKWIKEFPQKIILLYQGLLGLKWISPNTQKEDVMALFCGKPAKFTIQWNRNSTQLLWYLFKLIKDRNYVTRPEGVSMWAIEKNHFISKEGRMITDWSSQHAPQRDKELVEQLADLLDPTNDILEKSHRQEDRLLFGRE